MDSVENTPPLLYMIRLTEDQQRQIREQTGYVISAFPYESKAAALRCQFGGLTLRVTRGVFVPAAATERLFDRALAVAADHSNPVIVDVGTGCGAVALALSAARADAEVHATDVSDVALRCARRNRARCELANVRFRKGSLLEPLPARLRGRVHVIAANVPYVPPGYSSATTQLFPIGTAVGRGDDGLDLVRELAAAARSFLRPGASLVLQLADAQWDGFAAELIALGYEAPQVESGNGPVVGHAVWRRGEHVRKRNPEDAPSQRSPEP